MAPHDFAALQPGDYIQHITTGMSYIVVARYDTAIVAVQTVCTTHSEEWRRLIVPMEETLSR
jgi:hypothetical protein